MIKRVIQSIARNCGYEIRRLRDAPPLPSIPDGHLYTPLFSPWLGTGDFEKYYALAAQRSLVTADRCYVLYVLLRQFMNVRGDVWECGVYKGGTAAMMASLISQYAPEKHLYLFDTFEGMPETDPSFDLHRRGDFSDTSLESVRQYVGHPDLCSIQRGFIPETFRGLEDSVISFAHVDVDIYKSILDSLHFIWPRLSAGG